MFDPNQYSTRMRDAEGKRKKPSAEEVRRHLPREAKLRSRTTERFDAKRPEEPMPRLEKEGAKRTAPRRWGPLVGIAFVVLIVWRLAAGAVGQGLVLMVLGGLAVFFAATRREAAGAQSTPAPAPRPLRLPRLRTRRRATRSAPKPAPRPTIRRSRSKSASGWGVFGAVSLALTVGGLLTKACKPDRKSPVAHHFEVPRPRTVQPRRPGRTEAPDWRTQLPPASPERISGAIRFGGRAVAGPMELTLTPRGGRGTQAWTDNRGLFVFDRVRASRAVVEVRTSVHLGAAPRAVRRFPAGTWAGVIDLDTRHTLLLERQETRSAGRRAKAHIQVAATTGSLSGHGTWPRGHQTAIVSGLARVASYDVLVRAPDANRAALVERVGPGQRVPVSLGPVAALHGIVMLPPHAKPRDVRIVLTHGRLRVTAAVNETGLWRVADLPRGSWWDVKAQRVDHAGAREASRPGVHAGDRDMIVLDLQ